MDPYSTFDNASGAKVPGNFPGSNLFVPGKRTRFNVVAISIMVLVPWLLFSLIMWIMSSKIHYHHPYIAWTIAVLGLAAVVVFSYLASRAKVQEKTPMWYKFMAGALLFAILCACIAGQVNFNTNTRAYLDSINLNTYPAVDPTRAKGQQLMDVGRAYFAAGVGLDMMKSMSFKNKDDYCVVPIVKGQDQLASYDFWAVGKNCCQGDGMDFKCGEYNNPHARAGLRLMREDERPFYRLAVQQAEAAFNIRAMHPLFFEWMQDPLAATEAFRDAALKMCMAGTCAHFAINTFAVAVAVLGFSKIGRYVV